KQNVVLLFDRQRPGVQQRLEVRSRVEIAVLAHEQDVGSEHRLIAHGSAKLRVIIGGHDDPAHHQCGEHHDAQGRNDSPRTPRPEIDKAEASGADLPKNDRGDQKA
nr:hypothetical protein [Tanacetum cinerariifolium]